DLIGRLDESPADIMIADDAKLEGQPRFLSITDRRRHARIRDWDDDVRIDRAFAGEFLPDALACLVDALALDDAVGAREVDVLEDAEPAVGPVEGQQAFDPASADDDDLSRRDIADELGADDVE